MGATLTTVSASFSLIRAIGLAFAAAVGSGLISATIASSVDRDASFITIWFSYFIAVASVSLAAWVVLRLVTNDVSAFWSAIAVVAGLTVWIGARPPYPPTLDQLVDRNCRPRIDLLPYAISHRRPFWASVAVSADRSLEASSESNERCAQIPDAASRQDCAQWIQLGRAEDRYCRDHANRQLSTAQ